MTSPADDFTLLLAAPDATEAELARNLLEAAGIPCLLHGLDRDFAELGAAVHLAVAHPDLYVPKAAAEEARRLLVEAWGPGAVPDPPA